ncbi:MAG TPA: hypothetical protein VMF53_11705 [Alphaproteobacteria bacterium]|nr:hypothetical protein [Alphaproteobacteria bacterium]
MLSPNNIPALKNRAAARFIIATAAEDRAKLEREPIFRRLREEIAVEFLPNEESDPPVHKYVRMSRGHALLADRAFRDKAIAINVNPDSVYPDGCIAEAQRLAEAGKHVVLCAAVRFDMDGVERELAARGLLEPGWPFTLPMRDAVAIGLRNFHSETRASCWTARNFGRLIEDHHRKHFLTCCYWEVPGEDGAIIITHNWSPFVVNYGILGAHDTSALDGRALDGTYIFENFPKYTDSIEVVTDSDSLFLLGLTPRDEMIPPNDWRWWRSLPILGAWSRGYILNRTVFDPGIDRYRRAIYATPVRWHARDLNARWAATEELARRTIEEYVKKEVDLDDTDPSLRDTLRRRWLRAIRPMMF